MLTHTCLSPSHLFLGACNFIATCFNATANAPFGSSLHSGNATCHSRRKCRQRRRAGAWAVVLTPQTTAAGCSWVWVRFGLGIASLLLLRFRLVNCFACLLAALAWLAALVPFPVWVLRLNRIPRLLSVWFIASRGHHFALGTGGLKLSLLVGGLGPVYSLPKYCFKPFRRLSAVGFVLGWHSEPHLITTLQAPFSIGYCRTHGGNHRGWTSCGDR